MRAGTTTLHHLLRQIPGISVPAMKETNFFCFDGPQTRRGWKWYAKQFDQDGAVRCELSPRYAKRDLNPDVARQIAAANPEAKIFFIARDPVERAISQYVHCFHMGQNLPPPSQILGSEAGNHIVSTSRYAYSLEPYRAHFGDRIEILDYARLIRDPEGFLRDFLRAASVDADTSGVTFSVHNSSREAAQRPKWWGRLRESQLGDTLRSHVPRAHVVRFKRLFARRWRQDSRADVPTFSHDDKQRLIEVLSEDAAAFRKTFKKDFPDWSV